MTITKTIGFFGDSFCSTIENDYSRQHNITTYIKQLADHYSADIVQTGHLGSSIYDLLFLQLNPLIERQQIPDTMIFCWTEPMRLFSRQVRHLNSGSVMGDLPQENRSIWLAARDYYVHLLDYEKELVVYKAMLEYIDKHILESLSKNSRIIHLWSFGTWRIDMTSVLETTYPYTWQTGTEIRPSLINVTASDQRRQRTDWRTLTKSVDWMLAANHLDTQLKNDLVFDWIRTAIDSAGRYDYTTSILEQEQLL